MAWPTAVLDGGQRTGHLVVVDIGHGATGDQPHHQFNAFAAGLAHVVGVRHVGASHRVVDHQVQPVVVPLAVDQARTRALQLVAHASRAPNVDVQVAIVTLHRFAYGLPQLETAPAAGHGVLHHVDRERDAGARPGVFGRVQFTTHQRQGHGQAEVHVHLVHDSQIEVLLDPR